MPLPKPKKDEIKQAFISRCTGDNTMLEEYPRDQRSAICYSLWEGKTNNNMQQNIKTIQDNNYPIRTEIHQGEKHIVVPVIMMLEGVHHGSHGPILHLAEELSKFLEVWNGIPVPISHPEVDGMGISANSPEIIDSQIVGRIYNTNFADGKLKAEAWLNEQKLKQISPETLGYIKQQRPLDVSLGLFSDEEICEGIYKDVEYHAIAKNYRPDHLALLPGQEGACSWADGCGIRINQKGGGDVEELKKIKGQLLENKLSIVQVNAQGFQSILSEIGRKLDALDTEQKIYFLEEVYEGYCIYRVSNNLSKESKLYKQGYKINQNSSIDFIGDPIPVNKQIEYQELNINQNKIGGAKMADKKVSGNCCCPEKVNALIQDNSKYEEIDRGWLENLNEKALDKLILIQKETNDANKKVNELQANDQIGKNKITKDEAVQVLKKQLSDPEQFMQLLPREAKEQMQYGLKLHQEKRQDLINTITTNSDIFSKEELSAKEVEELEKLAQLVKPRTDYSVMSVSNNATKYSEELLLPNGVVIKE